MGPHELYTELFGEPSAAMIVATVALIFFMIHAPWKKGFEMRIFASIFTLFCVLIWFTLLRMIWIYLDGYIEVGFSWSCGTGLLLFAIIAPLSPLININIHYLTMIEEKGVQYALSNWKLPIILGTRQTKHFLVEVLYEGETDPEVRKKKSEEAKRLAKEKTEQEEKQREADRRFLLGEEE
jgi:hypothetical protein